MRRVAVAAAVAAVCCLVAGPAGAATQGPLTLETHLDPRFVFFGDQVVARLDVLFDPKLVDASSLQVDPTFGDWQELGVPEVESTRSGGIVHDTWQFTISCLTYACVPKQPSVQTFKLPPFTVSARTADGRTETADLTWPTVQMTARFFPPEVGNVRPALRPETQIPAARYTIGPDLLAWLLDAAGAVLLVGAAVVVGLRLSRRIAAKRRGEDQRSPLERALALVREAQTRDADDRRRAVGLLARTLESARDAHGRAASEVAWSKQVPSAERLEDLAETIDTGLEREPR